MGSWAGAFFGGRLSKNQAVSDRVGRALAGWVVLACLVIGVFLDAIKALYPWAIKLARIKLNNDRWVGGKDGVEECNRRPVIIKSGAVFGSAAFDKF